MVEVYLVESSIGSSEGPLVNHEHWLHLCPHHHYLMLALKSYNLGDALHVT